MQEEMHKMWAKKLGLPRFEIGLFYELIELLEQSFVDYTIFFRELCNFPKDIKQLEKSFYGLNYKKQSIETKWNEWLKKWHLYLDINNDKSKINLSSEMKKVNPKYTLREWHLVKAYNQASKGDYTLVKELQKVMSKPYDEQSEEIEKKYYAKKPENLFDIAGVSHVSCSS